jgi:2-dehydropantoate 2-reductase
MLVGCMHEILAVAHAHQIMLSDDDIETMMVNVDALPPNATTSLHRDIVDGRPSELEAWNGAIVRYGKNVGVATPLHEFIYHSLLPLELRARQRVEFPH